MSDEFIPAHQDEIQDVQERLHFHGRLLLLASESLYGGIKGRELLILGETLIALAERLKHPSAPALKVVP